MAQIVDLDMMFDADWPAPVRLCLSLFEGGVDEQCKEIAYMLYWS